MRVKNKLLTAVLVLALMIVCPARAMATPHFTLNPSSASETTGSNFTVTMGVDSNTSKVIGIDIQGTFDASKLQIVSIDKAANIPDSGYQFTYTSGQAIINNTAGTFEVTLPSANSSVYTGVVAVQDLLTITFKPTASGTATLDYVCTAGSVADSNIIDQSGNDVVDCTANQSGSYTISGTNSSSSVTNTPTPTSTSSSSSTAATATPTKGASLPDTGSVANTVALLVLGISLMALPAWYLKSI
jgi:LPXTG-motif cell wall-anchored protein